MMVFTRRHPTIAEKEKKTKQKKKEPRRKKKEKEGLKACVCACVCVCVSVCATEMQREAQTVVLEAGDGKAQGLDFSIRGGAEHGLPVVVSAVREGSQAAKLGLHVGCELLGVNGIPLLGASHQAVVKALTSHSTLQLTFRPNRLLQRMTYPPLALHSPCTASQQLRSLRCRRFCPPGRSACPGTVAKPQATPARRG
jgi:hypothetical protein